MFNRGYLERLLSWHRHVMDRPWLVVSGHRIIHVTSAVLICLALFASAHMRVWQYDQWSDAQDIYYVEDFPAYSTTDAAYFLLVAQEIKTHGTSKDLSRYRSYPDSIDNVPALERSILDEPLLGVFISYLSPNASLESLSMTAHGLLPISVMLTALAVILAFGAAGFWNEGAIAALGSSLSSAFLGRTSAGRLDTDQLNLGFFYLIIALIIGAGRVKNIWLALMLCGAAAAVTHLFHWWWPKPILNWFYLLGLVWLTYCFSRSLTRTALLGVVYLALISTLNFGPSVYVSEFTATITSFGQMKLPNTFDAIAELEVLSAGEFLSALMGNVWLGGLAILGIAGWVCVSPVFAVIFIPAICLAAMNTVFGNRVVFFAAPVFWFGLAWFALTSGRYVVCRLIQGNVKTPSTGFVGVQACLAFAMLATTYFFSFNPLSKPYVPDTAFSREVVEGFRYLGDHVRQTENQRQPVIATWWDYGYTASLFSKLPTLIDGGTQRGPKTHLLARALMSRDQGESARILKFIGNDGTDGVVQNSASNAALAAAFLRGPTNDRLDIYLVLTNKMSQWMPSITALGLWDSETGTPLPVHRGSNQLFYGDLACTGNGALINCSGRRYNLQEGTVDGRAVLSGAVQTDDGRRGASIDYPNPSGFYLQFNRLGGKAWSDQLIHPRLYHSTFNRLFYHGDFNPDHFTPLIDAYPYYRVYKIN